MRHLAAFARRRTTSRRRSTNQVPTTGSAHACRAPSGPGELGNRLFYLPRHGVLPADRRASRRAGWRGDEILQRIVIEKPFGEDWQQPDLNQRIAQSSASGRLTRIDHYLGKETVQNLLVLRFGNAIFERSGIDVTSTTSKSWSPRISGSRTGAAITTRARAARHRPEPHLPGLVAGRNGATGAL